MAPSAPSYPVALLLEGLPCLVVGGGQVARRKAEGLLAAGAVVTVVAPECDPELAGLPVRLLERAYAPGDCAGQRLVLTATGRPEVDRAVHAEAEAAGIFVNAADDVPGCTFFLPALLRRGKVTVAVSTDGESPVLAGLLRDRLGEVLGEEVGAVARLLGRARAELHAAGRSTEGLAWRPLAEELLLAAARGEDPTELARRVQAWLEAAPGLVAPCSGWGERQLDE